MSLQILAIGGATRKRCARGSVTVLQWGRLRFLVLGGLESGEEPEQILWLWNRNLDVSMYVSRLFF